MSRRTLISILVLAAVAFGSARAEQLVVFHNGRTLRIQEIRQEGEWSYLTLGKNSEIGVPNHLIASITEAVQEVGNSVPNVQASAGGQASPVRGGAPSNVSAITRDRRQQAVTVPNQTTQDQQNASEEDLRRQALTRAVQRVGGANPQQRGQQVEQEEPPGIELTPATRGWPSMLGDRSRGRDNRGSKDTKTDDDGEDD